MSILKSELEPLKKLVGTWMMFVLFQELMFGRFSSPLNCVIQFTQLMEETLAYATGIKLAGYPTKSNRCWWRW